MGLAFGPISAHLPLDQTTVIGACENVVVFVESHQFECNDLFFVSVQLQQHLASREVKYLHGTGLYFAVIIGLRKHVSVLQCAGHNDLAVVRSELQGPKLFNLWLLFVAQSSQTLARVDLDYAR